MNGHNLCDKVTRLLSAQLTSGGTLSVISGSKHKH